MDSWSAFAHGEAHRNDPLRCFDWKKAARLIAERKPRNASAGLIEDWEWTGGTIYRDGQPVPENETYVYLVSTWATPTLIMDGDEFSCYFIEGERNEEPYWSDEARQILETHNGPNS